MNCPKCGEKLDTRARFCMICGTKIERKPVCKNCGEELDSRAKFCMICGTPVEGAAKPAADPNATVLNSAKDHEYRNRTDLVNVVIADGVTEIGGYAFQGCTNLTSITIPNSVTEIGFSAFEFCTNLTSITVPNSVTYIGSNAFSHCTNLKSVTMPSHLATRSINTMRIDKFCSCDNLTDDNIKYI